MREERIKEILKTNLGVWDKEKAMRVAIKKCEEEIIEIIEDWSILEMDSDIKTCDIEKLKERIIRK